MANKTSFIGVTEAQLYEIERLIPGDCSTPCYRAIRQQEIPSVFPKSFREKMDHAVVMASGTRDGRVVVVINAQRVDEKDKAIDQEPFGVVLHTGNPATSGIYIHHGNWEGRTKQVTIPKFWSHVRASGIGDFFPPPGLQPGDAGELEKLNGSSNMRAFSSVIDKLIDFEYL
ncbi:MAG: hypothetical protein U0939_22755 [Pirellulales bacterium]